MADQTAETKLFHGSCHCGAFQFSIRLPSSFSTIKCNCAMCCKKNALLAFPASKEDMVVEKDNGSLTSYRFDRRFWSHEFCSVCGTHVLVKAAETGWPMAVNARVLHGFDAGKAIPLPNDGKSSGVTYKPARYDGELPSGLDSTLTDLHYGSCHCGAATYVFISEPLEQLSGVKECDCSSCGRHGAVLAVVSQEQARCSGLGGLKSYSPDPNVFAHMFCATCGIPVVLEATGPSGERTYTPNQADRDAMTQKITPLYLNLKCLDVEEWEDKVKVTRSHDKHAGE